MPRHRRPNRRENLRSLVAEEAARIIDEQSIRDYYQAKAKAAERLGLTQERGLPSNAEIEAALRARQSLFGGASHDRHIQRLRLAALDAMAFFAEFTPRLVGPVIEGTADSHSAVCLHVFVETAEQFGLFLDQQHIPYDQKERILRLDRERSARFPAFVFKAGEIAMDVTVLPQLLLRQPPLSPVDSRPMMRVSRHKLKELLGPAYVAEP